jgi:hypothetical protein
LAGLIEMSFDHCNRVWRVFAQEGGGEAREIGDVAFGEGKLEGGERRGK